LTAVFLWVSWCTADATQRITGWIVQGSGTGNGGVGGYGEEVEILGLKTVTFLPIIADGESTLTKDPQFDIGRGIVGRWMSRMLTKTGEDLKWRLGLIVGVMWIMNVLY